MSDSQNVARCELCGKPMPPGEEMFKFHGFSGPCPGAPVSIANTAALKGGDTVDVKDHGTRLVIQWNRLGVGFGELTFYTDPEGRLGVDEEAMGAAFCLDVLRQAMGVNRDFKPTGGEE